MDDQRPILREYALDTATVKGFSPTLDFPFVAVGALVLKGTDEQFRALVANFALDDVIVTMAVPGGTEDALSGLVRPTGGNPELADALRARDIGFEDFLDVYTGPRGRSALGTLEGVRGEDGRRALDAAEYRGIPASRAARDTVVANGYDEDQGWYATPVRFGGIRLADIKAIGATAVHSDRHVFEPILRDLALGRGKATAAELGQFARDIELFPSSAAPQIAAVAVQAAHAFGAEFARNGPDIGAVVIAWDTAMELDGEEAQRSFLCYPAGRRECSVLQGGGESPSGQPFGRSGTVLGFYVGPHR